MENEKKQLKKLVWSSHDRQNLSDDSSSYDIQFEQISDVSQFILRKAYIPLSTSTFQPSDDDRNWEISSVQGPIKFKNTSAIPIYMNFAYYTRPLNVSAGYGAFSSGEILQPRLDGLFKQALDAGQPGSIALRIFNSVSEANSASYLILYNLNSTVNYATIAQNLQNHCAGTGSLPEYDLRGLRFRDNWQTPFNENLDAKNEFGAQTVFSHPDASNDPGRDVIYFYNKNGNQDITVSIGWFSFNSITSKYDIPISGGSVFVNLNGISTKTSIGTFIYGIRPPSEGGWSNYKTNYVGFYNTIYNNQSLLDHLNTNMQSQFGITWSKTQTGDIVGLDKIVLSSTPGTGYRRIDTLFNNFAFHRLGYGYTSFSPSVLRDGPIGPWEDLNVPQPLQNMNIYYEIKCSQITIMPPGAPQPLPLGGISTGTHLLSDLIQQENFALPGYGNILGNIKIEVVKDTNAVNPGYYSLKMSSPDSSCKRLALRIDDKNRQIFVPTEGEYYFQLAAGVPSSSSTVASGLIFQPYFTPPMTQQTGIERNVWFANPLPDLITVSFDTTTYYTEASLLSTIQVVSSLTPALTFSIINHKLSINNSSETKGYLFEANDRLGIPIDITVPPLSSKIMTHDLDLSSLNDVVYVGLSLYSDGSNGVNKNIRLTGTPGQPRPQRKNIVASIVNTNDTNYGKYLVFDNQTEDWMKCDRSDFSNIHVDVYDSEYNLLNLNGITTHFSIIFR